jgi:hypothetical protein
MDKKTKEVLLRAISEHGNPTVTVLMKTCYLIDLTAKQNLHKQITKFSYIRYNYGPFDPNIYTFLTDLIKEEHVSTETSYFGVGNEVVVYKLKNPKERLGNNLSKREKSVVNKVLADIRGLGAKMLTQLAYQTTPMKKLGATLGGSEHIGRKLNLDAN